MWFPQWFIPFTIFYKKDKAEFMEKFPGQRCVEVSEEANLEDVQTNRKSIEMQKHLSPKIGDHKGPADTIFFAGGSPRAKRRLSRKDMGPDQGVRLK
mmetsp:Transcript_40318/g.126108  ORF Transcript_40318/g.126108 Transcript_40318/m.126108 type:complete len:97 (-) Transcript_40318:147-437(-)